MRATTLSVLAAALTASATPAAATGGFGCETADPSVTFSAEASMSRGMGGVFIDFTASLAIALDGVPDDMRHLTLDGALTHSWIDGKALKLQFYTERQAEPFASLDFVVETEAVEEGTYRGSYSLAVFAVPSDHDTDRDMWMAEGAVTCFVE